MSRERIPEALFILCVKLLLSYTKEGLIYFSLEDIKLQTCESYKVKTVKNISENFSILQYIIFISQWRVK